MVLTATNAAGAIERFEQAVVQAEEQHYHRSVAPVEVVENLLALACDAADACKMTNDKRRGNALRFAGLMACELRQRNDHR